MDGVRGGQGQKTGPQRVPKAQGRVPGEEEWGRVGPEKPGAESTSQRRRGGGREEGGLREREQTGGREREGRNRREGGRRSREDVVPHQGSWETRGMSTEVTVTLSPAEVPAWRLDKKAGRSVLGTVDQK